MLPVHAGQRVHKLSLTDEWMYCETDDNQQGYVPVTNLAITNPSSAPKDDPRFARRVLSSFYREGSDYLNVKYGEIVHLVGTVADRSGAYLLCRSAMGTEGFVPKWFLSAEVTPTPFPTRSPFTPSSLPTHPRKVADLHADAVNGFSLRLLEAQKAEALSKNVVLSAYSIHNGLAMAANGAEDGPGNRSFTELTHYLGFPGLTSHTQVCLSFFSSSLFHTSFF